MTKNRSLDSFDSDVSTREAPFGPVREASRTMPIERTGAPAGLVGAVIPCYKVRAHVLDVIARMPAVVGVIVCVDDACPDGSGDFIAQTCTDPRVTVVKHVRNQGVGGATMTGYVVAMQRGADVLVKVDGDGQMDPELIPNFIEPILAGHADYAKGNRFYDLRSLRSMPRIRLIGNAALSFMAKLSTGYWNVFDPTNGYTAIHARVLELVPLDRVARRYFFESDLLFWLSTVRAAVVDVPMDAEYADEESNLKITSVLIPFLSKHAKNLVRRFFYNFVLRDFSLATVETVVGLSAIAFGTTFGAVKWVQSDQAGEFASTGTVMLSALPIILGVQLLVAAFGYDVASVPKSAIHRLLGVRRSPQMARRRLAEYVEAVPHVPVGESAP